MRQVRQIEVRGTYALVPLTRGLVSVIDAADVPLVEGWNWSASAQGRSRVNYAVRAFANGQGGYSRVLLHRLLGGASPGVDVDHIDGDGLNNRRSNLRLCARAENLWNVGPPSTNSSGVKNVSWDASRQRWYVSLKANGKTVLIGRFENLLDAAIAADEARERLHGDFARHR